MRRLRIPGLVLFLIFSIWMLWLVVVGGIDTTLFGVSITSNEPMRRRISARRAVFTYRGVNAIGLYDLTPGGTREPRDIVAANPAALRAVPPALPPTLTLR